MMDFDNILDIASQNQGLSGGQKRYSLQAGPPKKDPRSKGVNPAAVQALIKKRHVEAKQNELKMRKKKEDLLAKRVELKSDRKARAMASRTKDNFRGYNGIPVVDVPKKRRTKEEMRQSHLNDAAGFRNDSIDPEDDEDNYEYEQTDSESEQEPLRPGRTMGGGSSAPAARKTGGPPKPAPPPLNFADLLKLAEKKQFEPVDLKPKKVKTDERLRTADELRELEMERKAKRQDRDREPKQERERNGKSQSGSGLVKKSTLEKEQKNNRPQKSSLEKSNPPSGSGKKSQSMHSSEKGLPSKSAVPDRTKTAHGERDRPRTSGPSSSGGMNSKGPLKATSSQVSTKQAGIKPSFSHKPSTSSDLSSRKESSSLPSKRPPGIPGAKPSGAAGTSQKSQPGSSQQVRPSQAGSVKNGPIVGGQKGGRGEPVRSGVNMPSKSSGNSAVRPNSGAPPKAGSQTQARQMKPGGLPQAKAGGSGLHGHPGSSGFRPQGMGPGRPGGGPMGSGRPGGSMGSGPGRPKCTVVSETISSKNVGGPRPGGPPRPGMPQRPPGMVPRPGMMQRPGMPARPGMPQRPMMNRPPVPMLPPITSAYKRKYEDEEEEYDPEMDDFIDDGGEEQDEISKHIREIFGYDRNRYKDESDYALKFMESSWKDTQKEEARSLRLAVQEDLEEEKRDLEELKKKSTKRRKN